MATNAAEKFQTVMANAQMLMLDENFNRLVDNKISGQSGKAPVDVSSLEEQAFGFSYSSPNDKPVQIINNPQSTTKKINSKLPKAILESFQEMPPLTGEENDYSAMGQMTKSLSLREQSATPMITPNQSVRGGIDYSLIKAIIDESISRQIDSIKKTILNENNIRGIKIAKGNKIQLLDNSGNLYEGVLTLKKRKTAK